MTKEDFIELSKQIIVLDGATGSNLYKAGMPRGISTEKWILEHEDVLINLQRQYVEAGSQIVLAPTFGANRVRLADWGMRDQMREINHRLVDLSQRAVEGRAYVAGDITVAGNVIGATPENTYESALENYKEQIQYLVEAGVDLIIAETMISVDDTMAALEAAQSVCDLPILCSLTVESDGSIYAGGNIYDAVESLQEMGASAVGLNCSVGPDQLEAIVANMKKIAKVPLIVKPNAGMPVISESGQAVYDMTPEDFARYMTSLIGAGAGIVGGCCGTTPEFIRQLCRVL